MKRKRLTVKPNYNILSFFSALKAWSNIARALSAQKRAQYMQISKQHSEADCKANVSGKAINYTSQTKSTKCGETNPTSSYLENNKTSIRLVRNLKYQRRTPQNMKAYLKSKTSATTITRYSPFRQGGGPKIFLKNIQIHERGKQFVR